MIRSASPPPAKTSSVVRSPKHRRSSGFQGQVSEVDLRLLRVFHTVAEQGGFSAAEISLGKSKSSISLDISALETRLGLKLCLRGRSGFSLTGEGRALLEATKSLLLDIQRFQQRINQISGVLSGIFRLYVPDNIQAHGETPLVRAIETFTTQNPNVFMTVHSASTREVEVAVMNGQATAGIALYPQDMPDVKGTPLVAEALNLYCGARHPLFSVPEDNITLEILTAQRMIAVAEAATSPQWNELRSHFSFHAAAENVDARALLILSGNFIGFLPEAFAKPLVDRGLLRRISFHNLQLITCFHFLARSSPETGLMVETFRALLEESY
ncbi:LysR family transcriptional regulator [Acetobacter tropicalis]|uniref:LysR family transcriptional regulator n=1 Tax=Acetobacter tropicalis TaxID=104102 RepID=A0A094YR72_9PROT|nr:LysR family transcriptional regulator [Acetobacter tropicalis]KAA8385975.1 LysR family transcriptional regulator [Acetobacter tropicalis]KAA8387459.1 LysR family transcriptional regulator [Acetobacter tropicalis]KGB24575.1 Transcriptional regulator, LysR family [Acetobacter tropicalis]KXV49382.1 LysR family transcriptional regulator [Acetobacter tropicalis]KXV56091.1 LysR family transcriptional regulator [Acetobacter tropicalis]